MTILPRDNERSSTECGSEVWLAFRNESSRGVPGGSKESGLPVGMNRADEPQRERSGAAQ
ncbi:hypothetical protein DIPPA_11203 [Diplonema papillatum]|nr:hypothetical protein DIPPA_11203 [Diplonema papillatum]